MLLDMRVKVRNRYSRLSSCDPEEFLPLSKHFFEFIKHQPIVESILSELLARNTKIIEEANVHNVADVYGDTSEESAALGYFVWQKYATQTNPHFFVQQA